MCGNVLLRWKQKKKTFENERAKAFRGKKYEFYQNNNTYNILANILIYFSGNDLNDLYEYLYAFGKNIQNIQDSILRKFKISKSHFQKVNSKNQKAFFQVVLGY